MNQDFVVTHARAIGIYALAVPPVMGPQASADMEPPNAAAMADTLAADRLQQQQEEQEDEMVSPPMKK